MENLIVKYYQQEVKKLIERSFEILEEEQYRHFIKYLTDYLTNCDRALITKSEEKGEKL